MKSARLSEQAERDLIDSAGYVAQDNPTAADRLVDRIQRKCLQLAASPRIGRARTELAAGLRSYRVGNYLIFYRVTSGGIAVARILHGARDLPVIFRGDLSESS